MRFSTSSDEADVVTLWSHVESCPRNFFVDGSRRLLLTRNGLLCATALQFFTSVFLSSLQFPVSLKKPSTSCSQAIPMLRAQKATDSTALALGRLVGEKPPARYSRLEKRKPVLPAVR